MKKKRGLLILVLLIVISVVAIKVYKYFYKAEAVSMCSYNDNQLTRTILSPHMEQKISAGTNILYCSTFQLSWNEMKNFMKGDIKLSGNTDLVTALNKSLSTKKDISEDSYIAEVGFKKDNLQNTINSLLNSKFHKSQGVDFSKFNDDDIIAYSYLYKNLQFEKEFESLKKPMYFNEGEKGTEVKAFGIKEYSDKNEKLGKQVDVIDYIEDNDFIISLKTKSENEELILAKVKPENTLLETIKSVNSRILSGKSGSLQDKDILMIPKFSFNISHSYSELIGKPIQNDGFSDYRIAEAKQEMAFVLDERGAIVESSSFLRASKGIGKHLLFNKPFLLYIKEKGSEYPYFAMWIDNSELMVKN